MPKHPHFFQKQALALDLNGVKWNIWGIDRLLNEITEKSGIPQMKGIVGDQAGAIATTIATDIHTADNEPNDVSGRADSTIVSALAADKF